MAKANSNIVPFKRMPGAPLPWSERGSIDLRPEHVANLRASDLTPAYIKAATAAGYLRSEPDGLIFVYVNVDGDFGRKKLNTPIVDDRGKEQRYEQDRGPGNHAFIPHGFDASKADPDADLIFTEGEKKVMCLDRHGQLVVGFPGVWSFYIKDPDGGPSKLVPELIDLVPVMVVHRPVVSFDYIGESVDAQKAALRLARVIENLSGRTDVGIRVLPKLDGEKCGVDDYIAAKGIKAYLALPVYTLDAPEIAHWGVPQDLKPTDVGNGERFAHLHGDRVRYCHAWKAFLLWDGSRWRRDEKELVVRLASDTTKSIYNEAARTIDPERRTALAKWAVASESVSRLRAMLDYGRTVGDIPIGVDQLDAHPMLLGVPNGMVDLATGRLLPPDPERLLTKRAGVAFDPAAECPRFEKFISDVMKDDPKLVGYVQRALGYALTGDTREHAFFIWHGIGANGKSTLLQIVQYILGDYATTARMETWMATRRNAAGPSEDLARLHGARFVASVEAEEGSRLAESLIKEVTGQDRIAARRLYEASFEFTPQFKIALVCNHRPIVRGDDPAVWRRLRLIPFEVVFAAADQDKTLAEKLRAEAPGILNWMIAGCLEWQRRGLDEPAVVTAATSSYREESDPLNDFITEELIVAAKETVPTMALYGRYEIWAENRGFTVMSLPRFVARFIDRGFRKDRDPKTRTARLHGLKINDAKERKF